MYPCLHVFMYFLLSRSLEGDRRPRDAGRRSPEGLRAVHQGLGGEEENGFQGRGGQGWLNHPTVQ